MPFIKSISFHLDSQHSFPYNVSSIKNLEKLTLDSPVTFIIGDNGTGKSTLIETIACWLQLPHMDGNSYAKESFLAARKLALNLNVEWNIDLPTGFFFRAEDFGDFMNSVDRREVELRKQFDIDNEVKESVLQQMLDNANYQKYHMKKKYGQNLQSFSHGEAYLHILQIQLERKGIFILDEPEAALSPHKQLSLIHLIKKHISKGNAQYIIASHSPILMAFPDANLYEITDDSFEKRNLEEVEHFFITKNFLNNPNLFLDEL